MEFKVIIMNFEDENEVKSSKIIGKEEIIKLCTTKRLKLFFILSSLNILINMDHGTIPAASNEIKHELKINETALGTFGSLVYFGNLVGALVLIRLIDVLDRKVLLLFAVMTNAIMIYLFTLISNIWFLFINRIIVGIMQSYVTIYFPVWVDQFGPKSWKTIMLTVFNITSPLGVIFGYVLTMSVKSSFNVSY